MPVVLALISGLFHAVWNTLAKSGGTPRGTSLAMLSYASLFALAALFVIEAPRWPVASWPWLAMAAFGESTYVYCLGKAYEKGDLALTYAITRALALVVIWPMSFLAFGTLPTALALVATALVVAAMWLARKRSTSGARWSVGFTCATGVSIAVYHTGYKGAVTALATPAASFIVAIGVTCPILWALQGKEVRREGLAAARSWRAIVGGALSAASFILMIIALTHADSGRILGVRNSSVGFATLFALWLGERPSKREWGALALLAVGIAVFAIDEAYR